MIAILASLVLTAGDRTPLIIGPTFEGIEAS